MLYISRVINEQYGVVDTDDDVETLVSFSELYAYVNDFGINIEGVPLGRVILPELDIFPYQPKLSVQQLKLQTMLGVETKVYKDEVVFIYPEHENTRVRLSDISSKYCANTTRFFGDGMNCTVVLDDKLEFSGDKFEDLFCATVDIRECSDGPLVSCAYLTLIDMYSDEALDEYLIDRKDRLEIWQIVALLSENLEHNDSARKAARKAVKYSTEVGKVLLPAYEKYFTADISEGLLNMEYSRTFVKAALERDFVVLSKTRFIDEVFGVVDSTEYANKVGSYRLAWRLENYFRYLKVIPEIKKLYLDLCYRIAVSLGDDDEEEFED